MKKRKTLWAMILSLNVLACAWLAYASYAGPQGRSWFTPGAASDGHHQIIASCKTCHVPFQKVDNKVCVDCHGKDLERFDDKHAESKFQDPRNAALIEKLDATLCITCHGEHDPKRTGRFGVTVPKDFCVECHKDIGDSRPSHKGLPFDGCAQAACHHYHDNRALYEDFLDKHMDEPDLKAQPTLPVKELLQANDKSLSAKDQNGGDSVSQAILGEWALSKHARGGVNCRDCHAPAANGQENWSDQPNTKVCESCHAEQMSTFAEGKHGMRQALNLSPILESRLPMKQEHPELACQSCHKAHGYAVNFAATESCTNCHDDRHSRAYNGSPHHLAWLKEMAGLAAPGSGVSCASCHLPRSDSGSVDHNQSRNFAPNDKMVRSVCLQCHGLEFSLSALNDAEQINENFRRKPSGRLKSMDMVRERK